MNIDKLKQINITANSKDQLKAKQKHDIALQLEKNCSVLSKTMVPKFERPFNLLFVLCLLMANAKQKFVIPVYKQACLFKFVVSETSIRADL